MTLLDILHKEYESAGALVLFRCTECGRTYQSLGSLHAHAENHRGLFGFQLPWRYSDFDALMDMTEVLRVEETSAISLEDVEGL